MSGYAALTRPTILMLPVGLDNKAAGAAALLPKHRNDAAIGSEGRWGPVRLGSEPVGPKQVRPLYLIVVRTLVGLNGDIHK